jgi:hypothetical protein
MAIRSIISLSCSEDCISYVCMYIYTYQVVNYCSRMLKYNIHIVTYEVLP